jgi:hypothetical protein
MAEMKTVPNDKNVAEYLDSFGGKISEEAHIICRLFADATGHPPRMWGDAIIGFGLTHLKYESGRELDWFLAGFAVRKNNFALYLMNGLTENTDYLSRLGRHKTGKSCLYIDKLEKIDLDVLRQMIIHSVAQKLQ